MSAKVVAVTGWYNPHLLGFFGRVEIQNKKLAGKIHTRWSNVPRDCELVSQSLDQMD
jgi:hypothetical protein